jgi:ATPase subunit of ABC transporter with duplicated ATPase domains
MAQYVFTMNRVGKIVPPKRQILKDISLSFFPGAKIGVLGLNGSGKSTLLKIMAGIDKDIEGEATPMPNLRIGYLPQEPVMAPDQTVREAVEEGLGATFTSLAAIERELELGRLTMARVTGLSLCRDYVVVRQAAREPSRLAAAFVAYCREA